MKNSLVILIVFILFSCNPVGEKLGEIPLLEKEISSIEGIDLRKGDEIVFWSKVATRKDSTLSGYKIKYSVSVDNKIIQFDSMYVSNGKHIINSKTEKSKMNYSFSEKKDSIGYIENWEFEIENNSYKIPQDGKYNFDFKLEAPEQDFFGRSSTSVILRKK